MPAAKRPSKAKKRGSTPKRLSDYKRPPSRRAPSKGKKASAKRRRPPARRSWAWRYRRLLFLVARLGATAIARVPLPPDVVSSQTTLLTDATGARLAELHGTENRLPVHLNKVPKSLQDAVIAAEDRHFFRHSGVDPIGVIRATWADLRGRPLQGGSTITQQYVKNTYVGRDRTIVRKLREAVLAVKLERKYGKREILERYLNTIYLGRGAYGVQAAADAYFAKDVGDLSVADSAYLAALIRKPDSGATDEAVARRNHLLAVMAQMHAISRPQSVTAVRAPVALVALRPRDATVTRGGRGTEYFVEYVRQRLLQQYDERTILKGGLRVQTTLDLRLQSYAFDAVTNVLDRPGDPDAAVVTLDDAGRVVAMVGGRDWTKSKVNLAVGTQGGGHGRQGGSAFKPLVLAATLKDGYSVESSFQGPPQIVIPKADNGKDWTVTNFEDESFDRLNLLDATAQSVNTVFAQLVVALGPEKVVETAHQLGIDSELKAVPSIALGTQDVSVLEMANVYSTFARGGFRIDPQVIMRVTTADGTVIQENKPRRTRVLDRDQADTVTYALRRVVSSGTGTGAAFGKPCAGKTGTSEDYGDAWFVGYTPRLTTAVWMGYAEGQSRKMLDVHGRKVNGGSFPATIFNRFMTKATRNMDAADFTAPASFGGRILGTKLPFDAVPIDPNVQHVGAPPSVQHVGPSTTNPPERRPATTTTVPVDAAPEPDEAPP
jgi:penicillin-binding protein 1A